ncbi:hypothetical protein FOL47_000304 [Perkinsus chesapeaki]|uniref:Peptidase A1 domain-containing protein n=1 Tax=Perkinsus chesapeaki TaxID=330153 RepID=A0A7J6MMC8_PERCH|nr:hypothetical protein FOL47_000304 [Perkinsus chesapeaki]
MSVFIIPLLVISMVNEFFGTVAQVIRVLTNRPFIPNYGYALLGDVSVDGQAMHARVDTRIAALYFTWTAFYERFTHRGACATLFTGCYECPGGCKVGQISPITYVDCTRVDIFSHQGQLAFSQGTVDSIQFGVVDGQYPTPEKLVPLNSIGLGLREIVGYRPLMVQLQGKITGPTFAMYLKTSPSPGTPPKGELLLGGGDPTVYVAPLHYVPLLSQQEYLVTIDSLQVAGGKEMAGINSPILIDTRAQALTLPQSFVGGLIEDLSDQASKAAGTKVFIAWTPALGIWNFECPFISYFPKLFVGLGHGGSVHLTVSGKHYTRNFGGVCSLAITQSPGGSWVFPDFMIIDRYVEFQPSEGRVGFADLTFANPM